MISLLTISLVITLVQCAHDNQRVVHVSELNSDNTFTDSDENGSICCVYGNCTCNSLDHALANLTSNVLINITTDVMLSSVIKLSKLKNVSIIGHNNPTVNCKNIGGLHFTFCHNCIIQAITWNECGTEDINNNTEPGLVLSYSTNIIINNCLFQYSKGQAVLLSAVSGNVNISNCSFTHNSQYRGHGAAIHHSSSNFTNCLQLLFVISECNFTYNKHAKSLVYIENRISECNNNIIFHNLKFCHNQGTSVYAISQNIYFNEKALFENNTEDGTALYIRDHSSVIFGENSAVTFLQNSAYLSDEIVVLRNHSTVIFDQNSMAMFDGNEATNGIVYSEANSNITFQGNCKVIFHGNSAKCYGAAIYSSDNSRVLFTEKSIVTFSNNVVSNNYTFTDSFDPTYCGGTIYTNESYISFEGNSTTEFSNNIANSGGAIFSEDSFIAFKDSSSTMFNNNTAGTDGGAISCEFVSYCYISFEGNSTTIFSNDMASHGGAIAVKNCVDKLSFNNFSTTIFSRNLAIYGGAIYSYTSIAFKANSTTVFSHNVAGQGGALSCFSGSILFEGYSVTVFSSNTADCFGGGISAAHRVDIIFSDNSSVTFTNNDATFGAAIYSNDSKIIVIRNSIVVFNDHFAKWCNNTCLPYHAYDEENVITIIESSGVVWCSNQKAFICSNKNCNCNKLEDLLDGLTSNVTVNVTESLTLSSVIKLSDLENISIIGHNNITVFCSADGGGLYLYSCGKLIIEGFTWIGCGIHNIDDYKPVIRFYNSSNITIQNCTFQYSLGPAILLSHIRKNVNINHCSFMNNNHYRDHGIGIYSEFHTPDSTIININNCSFNYNGDSESIVYFRYSFGIIHIILISKITKGHLFMYQGISLFFI